MARIPIHPGEHLAEELKELRMSAAELARQIDIPVNRALVSLTANARTAPEIPGSVRAALKKVTKNAAAGKRARATN